MYDIINRILVRFITAKSGDLAGPFLTIQTTYQSAWLLFSKIIDHSKADD